MLKSLHVVKDLCFSFQDILIYLFQAFYTKLLKLEGIGAVVISLSIHLAWLPQSRL